MKMIKKIVSFVGIIFFGLIILNSSLALLNLILERPDPYFLIGGLLGNVLIIVLFGWLIKVVHKRGFKKKKT